MALLNILYPLPDTHMQARHCFSSEWSSLFDITYYVPVKIISHGTT